MAMMAMTTNSSISGKARRGCGIGGLFLKSVNCSNYAISTTCSTPPSRSFGVAGDCERSHFSTGSRRFQQSFPENFLRRRVGLAVFLRGDVRLDVFREDDSTARSECQAEQEHD